MNEFYYTENPTAEHDEKTVIFEVLGEKFSCVTDAGVFSRDGLDMGTRVLLESLPSLKTGSSVLDLGCGWGPVGTVIGTIYPDVHITMTDINLRAIETAHRNTAAAKIQNVRIFQSDAFSNIDGTFDAIILNPPIRTGKAVIYDMFSKAKDHLNPHGALYIVIRKQQGAESAEKYLKSIYGNVERIAREKGYWVLKCEPECESE